MLIYPTCIVIKLCFTGILATISKPSFIVHLLILEQVLQIINILSTQFQNKSATLGSAVNLIEGVMKTFKSLRSEKEFYNIWMKIIEFSENNNLSQIISGKKKVSIINE